MSTISKVTYCNENDVIRHMFFTLAICFDCFHMTIQCLSKEVSMRVKQCYCLKRRLQSKYSVLRTLWPHWRWWYCCCRLIVCFCSQSVSVGFYVWSLFCYFVLSVLFCFAIVVLKKRPGPEVIKHVSCSTQLSTKFQLLIKFKIPTNKQVACFTFLRWCIDHTNKC